MKSYRTISTPVRTQGPTPEEQGGFLRSWTRFWFTPADPVGLNRLRVLAAVLFIVWLLPLAGRTSEFFGLDGWFDSRAYAESVLLAEGSPVPIGWSALYLCGSNPTLLTLFYWATIVVFSLFALGLWTRPLSILTWIAVASFMANPVTAYDGDVFLIILASYLMIGYLFLSLGTRGDTLYVSLLGRRDTFLFSKSSVLATENTVAANVALRLIQVHFAIAMMASGLHKLQFGEWWSGTAFWYPLYPPFEATLSQVRSHASDATSYLTMLSVGAYATILWQIAFPFFAWRRRWRPILIGGAIVGWLGCAFLYDLPLFGPAIFVCSLSFLTADEWHGITELLARIPGMGWLNRPAATTVAKEYTPTGARTETVAS